MQQNSSQAQYFMQQPGMHVPQQQMHQMQQVPQGYNNQYQDLMRLFQDMLQLAENHHQPTRQNQKRHRGAPTVEQKHKLPSVYVGNLPKDFYDLDFLQYFKSRGYKVLYAQVKNKDDPQTKRQNRFGFLNFTTIEEAQKCQQEMNNTQIHGCTINMSVVQPGFDDKANVIVRNLATELTQQQLWTHFSQYGQIKSLKLEESDGKSRGFCFIQFAQKEDAENCIKNADQTELSGKKIEVTNHKNKEERYGDNLYVQNLPAGTDDQKLAAMFADFGEIQSARVQRSDQGALTRQGFVCFKPAGAAQKALDAMNKKQMEDGSFLLVSHHVYSGNAPEGFQKVLQQTFDANLFVRNVPSSVTEEEVKKVFEKCGPIVSLRKRTAGQGKIKGDPAYVSYFILYAEVNAAKKAIQEFDQSNVFGARLLNVEFWESPEELAEKRDQRQWRQVKQFLYPPKDREDDRMDPSGGQRGGGYQHRGRGGKPNNNPRGGPMPQGPRGQQPMMQPMMMQANFPGMGAGFQGQMPMQAAPQMQQLNRQQIGDHIYPLIVQRYQEQVASKIVGVLLDSPQVQQQRLVEDQNYLLDMAQQVYQNYVKQLQQQQQNTPAQQ